MESQNQTNTNICNRCGVRFNEMQENTLELNYRYFTDDSHRYNDSNYISFCQKCSNIIYPLITNK